MNWCEEPVQMGRIVCPKPRRVAPTYAHSPSMVPLRVHKRDDAELKAGAELLGLILQKEDLKAEQSSSSPFLFGSPPCRTSNPVVQDKHFGVDMLTSICKSPTDSALQRLAHPREHISKKQEPIRVEGFNCQNAVLFPRHIIH